MVIGIVGLLFEFSLDSQNDSLKAVIAVDVNSINLKPFAVAVVHRPSVEVLETCFLVFPFRADLYPLPP